MSEGKTGLPEAVGRPKGVHNTRFYMRSVSPIWAYPTKVGDNITIEPSVPCASVLARGKRYVTQLVRQNNDVCAVTGA